MPPLAGEPDQHDFDNNSRIIRSDDAARAIGCLSLRVVNPGGAPCKPMPIRGRSLPHPRHGLLGKPFRTVA
jgi:hypothetical protein